jgi:exonuclease SbcD
MRFLHSADWHLGKTLCGTSLLDDQAHALEQVEAMVRDTRPHALVVAGDLYDRAVPAREAVSLLDGFLNRVVRDLGVPTLLIAGNHDSPERLGFASGFLRERGLFVAGPLSGDAEPVVLGDTAFHLLPYADPSAARFAFQQEGLHSHQEVLQAQVARALARQPKGRHAVAVAHAFVRGGLTSESELGLVVGGTGEVDAALFDAFAYVALGHLHAPQAAGRPGLRYAGSLLKYSASEAAHVKALSLVELGADGQVRTEPLPLSPRRDLRRLRGRFEELMAGIPGSCEDYLFLELTDEGPVVDAMARLRQRYPNVLALQAGGALQAAGELPEGADPRSLDPADLFDRFLGETQGGPMSAEERRIFQEVAGPVFLSEEELP